MGADAHTTYLSPLLPPPATAAIGAVSGARAVAGAAGAGGVLGAGGGPAVEGVLSAGMLGALGPGGDAALWNGMPDTGGVADMGGAAGAG